MVSLPTLLQVSFLAMALAASDLQSLLTRCANNVGPITMRAIIAVESSGNPYSINDDDAHHSYSPQTLQQAIGIALELNALNHNYDAGIAQINSSNFAHEGLDITNVFEPCTNVRAGARILGRSYAAATRLLWLGHMPRTQQEQHLQQQTALRHAFSIYNSGSAWRSMSYADRVVAAAQHEFTYKAPTSEYPPPAAYIQPQITQTAFLPAMERNGSKHTNQLLQAKRTKRNVRHPSIRHPSPSVLANSSPLYPLQTLNSAALSPPGLTTIK